MVPPRKIPAIVTQIRIHASDVRTFLFRPKRRAPKFRPGQFLHLAIDPYDPSSYWPDSRPFSMASSPSELDCIELTISKKGQFTTRLFEEVRVGDAVWLKFPYGEFYIDAKGQGEIVLIAGGTGITPFVSFLRHLSFEHSERPIRLFYGARNPDLLIYKEIIGNCTKKLNDFRVYYNVETPENNEDSKKYHIGQLSINCVIEEIDDEKTSTYYISGPPQMISAFVEELRGRSISDKKIRIDAWE